MQRVEFDCLEMAADQTMVWEGRPFTGIAVESTPDGRLACESTFVDGVQHGFTREWSPSGRLIVEENYRHGSKHGYVRKWFENGWLALEELYEYSIKTKETRWDADGHLTWHWEISAADPNFDMLQLMRRTYGTGQDAG